MELASISIFDKTKFAVLGKNSDSVPKKRHYNLFHKKVKWRKKANKRPISKGVAEMSEKDGKSDMSMI